MSESSNAATGVRAGDVLAGKYRIEKILGAGGMGVVVDAQHLYLDEKVAIKFLLPHALTNAEAVARFALEARAAVKIKSEHVARVIDVGTLETGDGCAVHRDGVFGGKRFVGMASAARCVTHRPWRGVRHPGVRRYRRRT